jgi:hypothetical protein
MVPSGWSAPTLSKNCPSAFKRTLSERVDWKKRFPSMAPKITRLTQLDFFLWRYANNIFYKEEISDFQTLRQCITEAVTTVVEVTLLNMRREVEYRFDVYRASNGAHTEMYSSSLAKQPFLSHSLLEDFVRLV